MKAQRGIALITAIILVALATIIATAISFGSALAARRAAAGFTITQALYVAEGAEALAGYALREDQKNNRQDSLDETWAEPYGPVEFDQGEDLLTHLVPADSAALLVAEGKIGHSLVAVALYYFDLWRRGLKKPEP